MVLYNLDAKSFILGATGASSDVEGTKYIDHNGMFDISAFEFADVNVENWFEPEDNGKVVVNQQLQTQTAREITANGNYVTTTNDRISVQVPNTYSASDNGKVVVNGLLAEQTTSSVTRNGTFDTTSIRRLTVNVPAGITPTGTITITQNGSIDVTNYATAAVNVPNTYSASDNGKVVANGVLVNQTTKTISSNGTYDTTTNNSVIVNTPTDEVGELRVDLRCIDETNNVYDLVIITDHSIPPLYQSVSGPGTLNLKFDLRRDDFALPYHFLQLPYYPSTGGYTSIDLDLTYGGVKKVVDGVDYYSWDMITSIYSEAFIRSTNLHISRLPYAVKSISDSAFWETGVSFSEIPNTCTYIGSSAFYHCKNLNPNLTFRLKDGTSSQNRGYDIGYSAFADCPSLRTVRFARSRYAYHVTVSIDSTAFSGCSGITDIYVPWSQNEVAGAPWGAANATIHYNTYTED